MTPVGPDLEVAAREAAARVLGLPPESVRTDTPLAPLGWDSLAAICWQDAMSEAGWQCRFPVPEGTIGDLAASCRPGQGWGP